MTKDKLVALLAGLPDDTLITDDVGMPVRVIVDTEHERVCIFTPCASCRPVYELLQDIAVERCGHERLSRL